MLLLLSRIILVFCCWTMAGGSGWAQAPRFAKDADESTSRLEERVADLEAYLNNRARAESRLGAASRVPGPGPGANAWQMSCTALVLFMSLPGLALFYGGLVRRKNVLSVLAQCLSITCTVTLLWWLCGYSLAFGGEGAFIGNFEFALFRGVEPFHTGAGSPWISDSVFAMYQLTFAIITPALIVGAIAERMRFAAVMSFIIPWMFLVYFPFAHMVWSETGFMSALLNAQAGIGALDFAGGAVVHMTSGWSALILCMVLGKRRPSGMENMAPHSLVLSMIGTAMLWVGWYGFNAGSALGADRIAANAFTTTTLAAATGGLAWATLEKFTKGKASVLGFCSGIVGGLVVITPGCGFVTTGPAILMGAVGGVGPFLAVDFLKRKLGYDDALDAFGVHGVGGTLGAMLTGVFASEHANPSLAGHLDGVVLEQLKACGLTILWSLAASWGIATVVKAVVGLRLSADQEELGLDLVEHGEQAYER